MNAQLFKSNGMNTAKLLAACCAAGSTAFTASAVDITSSVTNASFEYSSAAQGITTDPTYVAGGLLLDGQDVYLQDGLQNGLEGWKTWADGSSAPRVRIWNPGTIDRSSVTNNQWYDVSWGGVAPDGQHVLAINTQHADYSGGGSNSAPFDSYSNRTFDPADWGKAYDGTEYFWALDDGATFATPGNPKSEASGGSRSFEAVAQQTAEVFDPTARYILTVQVGRLHADGLNAGAVTPTSGTSSRYKFDAPAEWAGYTVELMAGGNTGTDIDGVSGDNTEGFIYGSFSDVNAADYIGLIAKDNNSMALAENSWGTSTVAYTPGAGGDVSGLAGKALVIRLAALEAADHVQTMQAAFDNVRLSKIYAGDANEDDFVNGADANIWRANFGTTAGNTWNTADFNGDGNVNATDANLWRTNFGIAPVTAESTLIASIQSLVTGDSTADFIYDPTTGQLSVSADGESVWSIAIATDENATSTNTPTNWSFADFGASLEWTDQSIGFFPLTSDFVLGTLATGLTAQDFGQVTYFTTSDTQTRFGTVEVIPEPSSLALLGLSGMLMARRRRNAM